MMVGMEESYVEFENRKQLRFHFFIFYGYKVNFIRSPGASVQSGAYMQFRI